MSEKVIITSVYPLSKSDKDIIAKKYFTVIPDAVFFSNSALVLKPDGTVEYIGKDSSISNKVKKLKCILKIVSGTDHAAALGADGRVFAAGDDTYGQCNVSAWENITELFAGDYCTIGIKNGSEILTAGTVETKAINDSISYRKAESLKSDIYDHTDRRIREQMNKPQRDIEGSISQTEKKLEEKADIPVKAQDKTTSADIKKSSDNGTYDKEKIIRFDGYYEKKKLFGKNEYIRFYSGGTVMRYFGNGTPEHIMDMLEKDSSDADKGTWRHTAIFDFKARVIDYEFEKEKNEGRHYNLARIRPGDKLNVGIWRKNSMEEISNSDFIFHPIAMLKRELYKIYSFDIEKTLSTT